MFFQTTFVYNLFFHLAPLRIKAPDKAPERVSSRSRDNFIKLNAFSPSAFAASQKLGPIATGKTKTSLQHISGTQTVNMDADAQLNTAVRDFTMLAFSSRRAGKKDVEASAYISLAVINDNQEKYKVANDNYFEYLRICEEIRDIHGQAIALNSIGVNYMLLACPMSDAG